MADFPDTNVFPLKLVKGMVNTSIFLKQKMREVCHTGKLLGVIKRKEGLVIDWESGKYKNDNDLFKDYYELYDDEAFQTSYYLSKHKYGRCMPDNYLSLATMRRTFRHSFCDGIYIDIDMRNAHPVILSSILQQNNIECEKLTYYAENPNEIRQEVMDLYNVTKDEAKELLISLCYGGKYSDWCMKRGEDRTIQFLLDLETEMEKNQEIIHTANLDTIVKEYKKVNTKWDNIDKERRGTTSLYAQSVERLIQEKAISWLIENKGFVLEDIVPSQDGFMILKDLMYDGLLDDINDIIQSQLNIPIEFLVKPFDEAFEIEEWVPDSPRGVGSLSPDSPRTDKWEDLLFNVIKKNGNLRLNYDEWFKIGCILKSNDYPLSLFLRFTGNNETEKTTQIWNGIEKRPLSIYALQKIGKKNNLMDYQQWLIKYRVYISTSILNKGENDIAKFIAPQLKGTVIYTGKMWWKNNGTIWISSTKPPLATIISAIQTTIDESLMTVTFAKNQTDDEAKKKKLSGKMEVYLIYHSKVAQGGISSQIAKLLMEYCYDANFESNLDKLPYKIVYDDGIFDLRTLTFTNGIRPSDFVSQTLPYSYKKGIPKMKVEIREAFKKICNYNEEHLEYYLSLIGYCLTGDASALQEFYAFIGQTASNGKSTALVALQNILNIYVVNTDKCAFDEGNKKIHKEIATWRGKRIIWLNEGSGKQQDTQLLKDLSDGTRIKFDRLYGTNENMDIQAKIIFVSNNSLATKIDNGIIRRYKHLQFDSRFIDKEDFVENKEKLEFKKIAKFDDYLIENKHSFLELLYEYSQEFYLAKKLPTEPKEFSQEKAEMIVSNDKFSELFDEYFEVGGEYKCWKNDFEDVMKTLKGFTLKDECKRKGYKYDSQKYVMKEKGKKCKGVYIGFRVKIEEIEKKKPDKIEEKKPDKIEEIEENEERTPDEAEIDIDADYKK